VSCPGGRAEVSFFQKSGDIDRGVGYYEQIVASRPYVGRELLDKDPAWHASHATRCKAKGDRHG